MRLATMATVLGSTVVICLSIVLVFLIRRSWRVKQLKHPERVEAEGCPVYGQYYFPGDENRIDEGTTEVVDVNRHYEPST